MEADSETPSLDVQKPTINPTPAPTSQPPKKTRKRFAIFLSIIFGLLYSIAGLGLTLGFSAFAMGCGGGSPNCSQSPFPQFVLLAYISIVIILAIFQFLVLRNLLPFRKRFLLLWIIGSWAMGIFLGPVVWILWVLGSSLITLPFIYLMYAPFMDAQKFHPRVTLVDLTSIKNPQNNKIDSADVTISVTASKKGHMEITGGLFHRIEEKGVMNLPLIRDKKTIQVSTIPTQVVFHFVPDQVNQFESPIDTTNLQSFNIFGVFMNYRPDSGEYSSRANVSYNPVDDVDDSKQSVTEVLPDFDKRTVFYKIGIQ